MRIVSDHASLWFTFLQVRAHLIDQWHGEGKTDFEIARTLSMDSAQVRHIRLRDRAPPFDGDVVLAKGEGAAAQPGEN